MQEEGLIERLRLEINLLRNSWVEEKIKDLRSYFTYLGKYGTPSEVLSELAFCILAANYSAEKSFEIQQGLKNIIMDVPINELVDFLKRKGYRYPEPRARYIVDARTNIHQIIDLIRSKSSTASIRIWLTSNLRGVGMKVASHFLRNTGRFDVSIIDFHILDFLARYNIVNYPKTLTPKRYLEIERKLFRISNELGLEPGILDLYLWYLETGKIVK